VLDAQPRQTRESLRDDFEDANPVNRELLSAAARAGLTTG